VAAKGTWYAVMGMKYEFSYKITALDLWKLSMQGIYTSMIGVCNIIVTTAVALMTVRIWRETTNFIKILCVMGVALFPVIQPLAIYIRAKGQMARIPRGLQLCFDDSGVIIQSEKRSSKFEWNMIKGISKRPNAIIIYTKTNQGYILTNKVLGEQKEDFYNYVVSKITTRERAK